MRQLVYTMFTSNNCPSFHFWWKENFIKHLKVSKCYENECKYKLVQKPRKQINRNFIDDQIKATMDCNTTSADKFRKRLRFKQYDDLLTKEQSVLTIIIHWFEGKNIQGKYNVLSYGMGLYFH